MEPPPLERPVRIISWNVAAWCTTVEKIRIAYGNTSPTPNTTHNALTSFLDQSGATLLCLQETKVTHRRVMAEPYATGASEALKKGATQPLGGWETFWTSNTVTPGFNGVGTYVKEGMTLFADPRPLGVADLDDEGRCLLTVHKQFAVFNVYAPYSRCYERHVYKFRFYVALLKAMARVRKQFAVDAPPTACDANAVDATSAEKKKNATVPIPLILVGDFNLIRHHRDMHWTKWSIPLDYLVFLGIERGNGCDSAADLGTTSETTLPTSDGAASPASDTPASAISTSQTAPSWWTEDPQRRPLVRTLEDVQRLVRSRTVHSFENTDDPINRHNNLIALAPFLYTYIECAVICIGVQLYNRHCDSADVKRVLGAAANRGRGGGVDNDDDATAADLASKFSYSDLFKRQRPTTVSHAMDLVRFHMAYTHESFCDVAPMIPSSHIYDATERGHVFSSAANGGAADDAASSFSGMHSAHSIVARAEILLAAKMAAAAAASKSAADTDNADATGGSSAAATTTAADGSEGEFIQHANTLLTAAGLPPLNTAVGGPPPPPSSFAPPRMSPSNGADAKRSLCVLTLLMGICASDPHMRRLVFGTLLRDEYPFVGAHRNEDQAFATSFSGGADAKQSQQQAVGAASAAVTAASVLDSFNSEAASRSQRQQASNVSRGGAGNSEYLPRMIDVIHHAYPTQTRNYTCWDQSKNGRGQNFGARIDYILVDEALTRFVSKASGAGGGICQRPFLLRWDPTAVAGGEVYGAADGAAVHGGAEAAAAAYRQRMLGLESGMATQLMPTATADSEGVGVAGALLSGDNKTILAHKDRMRHAVNAAGLYPSAPPTGEGLPPPGVAARECTFVPLHKYSDASALWDRLTREKAAASRNSSASSAPSSLAEAFTAELRSTIVEPLRTGMFCSPSQYSDHQGVVVAFGNMSEEDLFIPQQEVAAGGGRATMGRYQCVAAAQYEALVSTSASCTSPSASSSPRAALLHQFIQYAAKVDDPQGNEAFTQALAAAACATPSTGAPINISRIHTREARDVAFAALTATMRDCTYRRTQTTLFSMFSKMGTSSGSGSGGTAAAAAPQSQPAAGAVPSKLPLPAAATNNANKTATTPLAPAASAAAPAPPPRPLSQSAAAPPRQSAGAAVASMFAAVASKAAAPTATVSAAVVSLEDDSDASNPIAAAVIRTAPVTSSVPVAAASAAKGGAEAQQQQPPPTKKPRVEVIDLDDD